MENKNDKKVILTEVVGAETLDGYNILPITVADNTSVPGKTLEREESSNDKYN